jgi:L-fuconolactonase
VTTPLYGRGPRANEYTMRCIEAHPDRLYGIGLMDFFQDEKDVREALRRVVGHERMLGVRMHAALKYDDPSAETATADWILDDRLGPVWSEAAEQDTCVFFFVKAPQLSMIARLAEEHSDVSMVVDHMAYPDETTSPDSKPWRDFESLAEHDNVYVKVSSLPRSSTEGWPYSDLRSYVRKLLSWFGPERLMLGSDYPWMSNWGSYEECLTWIEEATFLSARDYSYLTHRTFERLHR